MGHSSFGRISLCAFEELEFQARPVFFGQINPSIVRELKEKKFDGVLIQGYVTMTSWFIYLTRWYTGAKVILRGEADMGKQNGALKNLVKSLVLKNLFKTIPTFLYSYQLNKEFFRHFDVPEEKLFSSHVPWIMIFGERKLES